MTPALACYFRKISFLDANRIPASGPVVVISNHAASFLDAIVMGVMLKRSIHFYARGDIFRKRWVRYILSKLHMIPIFSADLAKNDLHRNAGSFDQGVEVLKKGGLLLIFPEGLSRLERNIMPLKKGASRIIMQAIGSDLNLQVQVVPIGIHYSKHAFRSHLQLMVGEVLDASSYRLDYEKNVPKTINVFTDVLQEIFREVVLYVEQDERSMIVEQQLEMLGNEQGEKFSYEIFGKQKELCETISEMSADRIDELRQLQNNYFSKLSFHELNDRCFTGAIGQSISFSLLVLGFPFFAAGALLNVIPYMIGKYFADTKVSRADFYTSVLVAVSAFSYLLWLICLLVIGLLLKIPLVMSLVFVAPLLAWFTLWWMDKFRDWKFRNRYNTIKAAQPHLIQELIDLRMHLRNLNPQHRSSYQSS